METVIMHPKNEEQLAAIKAFAKALKVEFETEKNKHDPAFVKKILKGSEQIKRGKGVEIAIEDLWK